MTDLPVPPAAVVDALTDAELAEIEARRERLEKLLDRYDGNDYRLEPSDVDGLVLDAERLVAALRAAYAERDQAQAELATMTAVAKSNKRHVKYCTEEIEKLTLEHRAVMSKAADLFQALQDHMKRIRDMQPWDNQAMFERLLAGLLDIGFGGEAQPENRALTSAELGLMFAATDNAKAMEARDV